MTEITDDDIREAVERLVRSEDLDDSRFEPIVLMVQRLVWPPSPHAWVHEGEHIIRTIIPREKGGGWQGRLSCPHGCGRCWQVNVGPSEEAVFGALEAAHLEYRTGRSTAVATPSPAQPHRRMSMDQMFGRAEYVEVTDERLTPEKASS